MIFWLLMKPSRRRLAHKQKKKGWVCLVARVADCKSVTKKHRKFESCPIHFPFACPSGLWCHPAKVVCGNAPKVRILPQTFFIRYITRRIPGLCCGTAQGFLFHVYSFSITYSHSAAQSESSLPDALEANRFPFATFAFGAKACICFAASPIGLPPEVANGITFFPPKS